MKSKQNTSHLSHSYYYCRSFTVGEKDPSRQWENVLIYNTAETQADWPDVEQCWREVSNLSALRRASEPEPERRQQRRLPVHSSPASSPAHCGPAAPPGDQSCILLDPLRISAYRPNGFLQLINEGGSPPDQNWYISHGKHHVNPCLYTTA